MASIPSAFGHQLRYWRKLRGLSQLDLALEAGVSPRHVSFIETGRSRPRSPMVLKLSEVLEVPIRDRNSMLRAAGLPNAYTEAAFDEDVMAPFRRIVKMMLERHEPYPAYVIDGNWYVIDANEAAKRITPGLDQMPVDSVELFFAPGLAQKMIENWEEIVWVALARMRREATASGREELVERVAAVEARVAEVSEPPASIRTDVPVMCPRIRLGDQVIQTVTTISQFGNAQDVTLDELKVELVFPGDDAAAAFFESMAG